MTNEGLSVGIVERHRGRRICITIDDPSTGIVMVNGAEAHIVAVEIEDPAARAELNILAADLIFTPEFYGRTATDERHGRKC